MGKHGKHGKNKGYSKQSKKEQQRQAEHQEKQKAKQEERKSKRQLKREKNAFNKAKYESDMTKFRKQLTQYGLKVVEMGGDGNCLFRSIADQIEGNEKLHRKYRQEAIDFITENKDDFSPFIEDDETIDQYLSDLQKDGTWGSQLELQALSQKFRFNYIVHQVDNPIMAFSNYPWGTVQTVHVSYHLGEHYNSVRLLEDPCNTGEPPLPIGHDLQIKNPLPDQQEGEETKQPAAAFISEAQSSEGTDEIPTRDQIVKYAISSIGLQSYDIMSEALNECFGKDEVLTFELIEQLSKTIVQIYEELEIKALTKTFDARVIIEETTSATEAAAISDDAIAQIAMEESQIQQAMKLSLQEEEKQIQSPQQSLKKQMTDEEKLRELFKSDMILTKSGEVVPMPQRNKKCPCNSKKNYKNCDCSVKDMERKTEFVNKMNKKLEEQKPKQQSILLL